MQLPLSPLRVFDFTVDMPGALASQFLSDYGTEVIKIEPLEGGALRRKGLHLRYALEGGAFWTSVRTLPVRSRIGCSAISVPTSSRSSR